MPPPFFPPPSLPPPLLPPIPPTAPLLPHPLLWSSALFKSAPLWPLLRPSAPWTQLTLLKQMD